MVTKEWRNGCLHVVVSVLKHPVSLLIASHHAAVMSTVCMHQNTIPVAAIDSFLILLLWIYRCLSTQLSLPTVWHKIILIYISKLYKLSQAVLIPSIGTHSCAISCIVISYNTARKLNTGRKGSIYVDTTYNICIYGLFFRLVWFPVSWTLPAPTCSNSTTTL